MIKNYFKDKRGSSTVVFAISLPVLIGSFAMAFEIGFWQLEKRKLQDTADMAAYAGAYEYMLSSSEDDAYVASLADANDNFFDGARGNIAVNIPPESGDFIGQDAVEVTVTKELEMFFGQMFFSDALVTTGRAVVILGGQSSQSCVLSLNPNEHGAISVAGTSSVTLDGCGLHSNSSSDSGVNAQGNVTITAACLSSVGGVQFSGNSSYDLDECAAPRTNQPRINDPYDDLDIPLGAASLPCASTTKSGKGKNAVISFPDPAGGVVRFCGGNINISGDVNLSPGTYVFDGTDINMGNHAHLRGDGVTLVFMNDGELSGLNGNNHLTLTPPTTGDYAGVAIYGDRHTMSRTDWDFAGNGDINITGVVYLPTIDLEFGGGSGAAAPECTHIISNTVSFQGNSSLENDCDAWGVREIVGGAYTTAELVE